MFCKPLGFLARSKMPRLIGIAAGEGHRCRAGEDFQIEEKAPIVDIPEIEIDPFFHLIEMQGLTAAPVDLGEPGETRLDVVSERVIRDECPVFVVMGDGMGRMRLKVNEEKSGVRQPHQVHFLGFRFQCRQTPEGTRPVTCRLSAH
jgi:hypothetical protein